MLTDSDSYLVEQLFGITQGDWRVLLDASTSSAARIGSDDAIVCTTTHAEDMSHERANARAIAAVPQLLLLLHRLDEELACGRVLLSRKLARECRTLARHLRNCDTRLDTASGL